MANAHAIDRSCVMLTSTRPMSSRLARARARPCNTTTGLPRALASTSISRQPTPRAPVPSAFITASLAAKRAASSCSRSPQ